jgi:hypothetical protein
MITMLLAASDTPTTWSDVAWTAVVMLGIAGIIWASSR